MVRWKLALPIVTSSYLSNIPPFSSFHPDLWEEYFNVFQGFRQPTKRCVHPDPKSFGQSKIMVIKKPSHKSHSDRLHQAFEIILGVSTSTQKGSRSLSTSWAPQQILIPLPNFSRQMFDIQTTEYHSVSCFDIIMLYSNLLGKTFNFCGFFCMQTHPVKLTSKACKNWSCVIRYSFFVNPKSTVLAILRSWPFGDA